MRSLVQNVDGNKSLSTVVLTQNNLCKHIPSKNKNTSVYMKLYLKKKEIMSAPSMVMITSTMATPNNLYE